MNGTYRVDSFPADPESQSGNDFDSKVTFNIGLHQQEDFELGDMFGIVMGF